MRVKKPSRRGNGPAETFFSFFLELIIYVFSDTYDVICPLEIGPKKTVISVI